MHPGEKLGIISITLSVFAQRRRRGEGASFSRHSMLFAEHRHDSAERETMDQEFDQNLTLEIDGISFQARQRPDLRWIRPYGRVFRVFDRQASGNLCFGVDGPYGKLFIKYAGAQPVNYSGRPADAAYTLQKAVSLYAHPHPALIRLLAHGPAGEGYAAIFAWEEGEALRAMPPDLAVRDRVRRLQIGRSLKMLDMVFDLHASLAQEGMVAVDFWDGNLLIDFQRDRAVVCDIDLYRRRPAFNDRGRMQGSSRFLSPEEYTLGAALDESTTVYAMGALAFEFYGDNMNRAREQWVGPAALFPVAEKATREKREERYPTLRVFLDAWREAVRNSWIR